MDYLLPPPRASKEVMCDDILYHRWAEESGFEKEWRQSQKPLMTEELAETFGKDVILEVTETAIQETQDRIASIEEKIQESFEHAKRVPEATPICQAVAGFLYRGEPIREWVRDDSSDNGWSKEPQIVGYRNEENALYGLKKRIKRLEWQEKVFTAPKNKKWKERIPAEELKANIDLPLFIQAQGVKLQKRGRLWQGLCPFHQEKTPSFTVFADRGYKCFGCGEAGDVFSFVQRLQGLDFNEAYSLLEKYA